MENEQTSGIDSGFYDIMIHKQANYTLDQAFTLVLVNRRTDPLIYEYDTLTVYNSDGAFVEDNHLFEGFRFYSTYEMETNCDVGGDVINPTTLPDCLIQT